MRDGRNAMPSWDLQYQRSCGARFHRSQYLSGWREGFVNRPG